MTASSPPRRLRRTALFFLLSALFATVAVPAGADRAPGDTPAPPQPIPAVPVLPPPNPVPTDPLVIGTFALAPNGVIDGDTVRVVNKPSIRVLCVDTEETFKKDQHRRAAEINFAAYAREMRGDSKVPVKFGTPAGEAAKTFAKQLMTGVTNVRLERDEKSGRDLDSFGRMLCYVIALRPEGEVNLSEALIRSGHSPYFVKYGRSNRFHERFLKAEAEARAAKRGIWGAGGAAHYPDYEERLRWWHARDKQLHAWQHVASLPDHITLGTPTADEQLRTLVGKSVTVFGSFERLIESKTGSKILILSHRKKRGLPLVVFQKSIFAQLDLHGIVTRYSTVTGKISLYRGRPQIVINEPNQVVTK